MPHITQAWPRILVEDLNVIDHVVAYESLNIHIKACDEIESILLHPLVSIAFDH